MKYFYLFFSIVYLPLFFLYIYQRNNPRYESFKWGVKNRIGVWIAIMLAMVVLTANFTFPSLVDEINEGWEDYRGRGGQEIFYCIDWLIALTLLIFPHIIKRNKWPDNPTPLQISNRFNANAYWYGGLAYLIIPIMETWDFV